MGLLGELWRRRGRPSRDQAQPPCPTRSEPDRSLSHARESRVLGANSCVGPSHSLPEFAMLLARVLLPVALLAVLACTQPYCAARHAPAGHADTGPTGAARRYQDAGVR